MIEQFKKDIDEGLSAAPKSIPSKYFYDHIGDQLFIQIMNMPEYYPTRAELEIFKKQSPALVEAFGQKPELPFELIELGAGDGTKTVEILKALMEAQYQFTYVPIDISSSALAHLEEKMKAQLPALDIRPKHGDYFHILETLRASSKPKVLLFLGSNIGNMPDHQAHDFVYQIGAHLKTNDKLLLGIDLIKPEEIVGPAYDDPKGITRDFNLNLLHRINRELGGTFEVQGFRHAPEYTEKEGIAKSYLVSEKAQTVNIASLGKSYHFEKGEKMLTEISRKYDDRVLQKILQNTDFQISSRFTDEQDYFADYILTRT